MANGSGRLAGRVVIVVGGATGVGAGAADRLAAEGADVVIGDLAVASAERTADVLAGLGARTLAVEADTADEKSMLELVRRTLDEFGRVDGLYSSAADTSNATIHADTDAVDIDLDVFDRTLRVNLRGSLLACRAVIPAMLRSGGGSIVLTSSLAYRGLPNLLAYGISKAGLHTLTNHISVRWGREGIRCNTVVLGMVMTDKLKDGITAEAMEGLRAQLKVPEPGVPAQIGEAVAFLLSDGSSYINGQSIHVDGGMGN